MIPRDIVVSRPEAMPRIEWLRCLPFLLLHVACIAVFWVGWSWTAVAIALVTLFLRVFGLTGFLPPVFLAPRIQDLAVVPVRRGGPGFGCGAERATMVGSASPFTPS